jgi:hypothetical protein
VDTLIAAGIVGSRAEILRTLTPPGIRQLPPEVTRDRRLPMTLVTTKPALVTAKHAFAQPTAREIPDRTSNGNPLGTCLRSRKIVSRTSTRLP